MRFFDKLVASVLLLSLVLAPVGVFAHEEDEPHDEATESAEVEEMNSYELFWPIVAGKVMGEPLYFLKTFKESIRELLIFSVFKKSDYNITLSAKRVVEAEKLFLQEKDYENAKKSLNAAQAKREKALTLLNKTKEQGRYTTDLENAFTSSLEKQRALLNWIASQVPDEQKSAIEENISQLNSTLAELQ